MVFQAETAGSGLKLESVLTAVAPSGRRRAHWETAGHEAEEQRQRRQSRKWQRLTLWPPGGAVGVTVLLLCPQSADRMHLIRRRSRKLTEQLQR